MDVARRPSHAQWLTLVAVLGSFVLAVALALRSNDLGGALKAFLVIATALSVILNVVLIVTHPKGSPRL